MSVRQHPAMIRNKKALKVNTIRAFAFLFVPRTGFEPVIPP